MNYSYTSMDPNEYKKIWEIANELATKEMHEEHQSSSFLRKRRDIHILRMLGQEEEDELEEQ